MSDSVEAVAEEGAPIPGADERQAYYAQAASWAEDRRDTLTRSRGIAWIIAAIATTVAILEALALVALTPLKTVEPYTLLVDRSTGFVQALKGTQPQALSADEALIQSMLAQYVVARESFDVATISNQYRKVALWSAENARRQYLGRMPASNPASPFNRYPRSTIVSARVSSVSPLDAHSAMVRFVTERRDASQDFGQVEHWVAVMRYRFSGEPMSIEDRLVNPLGFQVVQYRIDQEAAPEQAARFGARANEAWLAEANEEAAPSSSDSTADWP